MPVTLQQSICGEDSEVSSSYDDGASISFSITGSSRSSVWDQDDSCLFQPSPLASLGFSTFAVSCASDKSAYELMNDAFLSWKRSVGSKPCARTASQRAAALSHNNSTALLRTFWSAAVTQMAQTKLLVRSAMSGASRVSEIGLCRYVFTEWVGRASRLRESERNFKQRNARCLLKCFSEWRIFSTRQKDLSASASTIAAQVSYIAPSITRTENFLLLLCDTVTLQWEREMKMKRIEERSVCRPTTALRRENSI